MFAATVLTCFVLGFAAGRSAWILLVIPLPIAFWLILGEISEKGPDDDVTGPLAALAMGVSLFCIFGGVAARWFVQAILWAWRRAVGSSPGLP